jgi:methyltransferase (TIGR00027 family)
MRLRLAVVGKRQQRFMTEPLIKDVSDTAFWIAHHRAVETERRDALFHDPLAARLAGEHGRNIAQAMPNARIIGWATVMRTCIIDDFIQAAIAKGIDSVVNLGAGLDTRPYRMTLPASLDWIEADYPHIVEYKESRLVEESPHCRLERVKIDLADLGARRALFARLDARAGRMLILTEGVVPYLSIEEAASLADDLRALDHVRYWVTDYFSPEAMKVRRHKRMGKAMQNAPFRFAPADWFAFFGQHGWRVGEMRYLVEEGARLQRPIPLPWYMQYLARALYLWASPKRWEALRNFAAYALLERC